MSVIALFVPDPAQLVRIGPGVYTLVVEGSVGPNRRVPALYDIEVAAKIPLPAAGLLLIAGLGSLVALRRRPV